MGGGGYDGDGSLATMAQLGDGLTGIAFDTAGCMYITDSRKSRVRKVNLGGVINTIAGGGGGPSHLGDGGDPLLAYFSLPASIAVVANGDIFISDYGTRRVRMISNHIVGVPEVVNNSNDIIVYPNPTHDYCSILVNSNTTTPLTITITDVTGKPVHRCTGSTRQPISIATCWQPGMYTVAATTATEQHTATIVIQ